MSALLLSWLLAAPAWADCADPDDPPVGAEDCDEDGWKKSDGDCDDDDPDANPGAEESCDAPADENCDGFFNEGCDRDVQRGSLSGGGACGSTEPVALLALPLLGWRRRRRAC